MAKKIIEFNDIYEQLSKPLTEAKKKKKVAGAYLTWTTGNPDLNIKHFNKLNGTDFEKEEKDAEKAAEKAAEAANDAVFDGSNAEVSSDGVAELAVDTGAMSTDISGDAGDLGGDSAGDAGSAGEGGGDAGGCCESLLDEASNLTPYEKMELFDKGQRRENVAACGDQKLFDYQYICINNGFINALVKLNDELLNRGLISAQEAYNAYQKGRAVFQQKNQIASQQNTETDEERARKAINSISAKDFSQEVAKLVKALPDGKDAAGYMVDLNIIFNKLGIQDTDIEKKVIAAINAFIFALSLKKDKVINDAIATWFAYYSIKRDQIKQAVSNIFGQQANFNAVLNIVNNLNSITESKENNMEIKKLDEGKGRKVTRYFIRPQNIWCANKADVLRALIDIGNENCSVYSLKNLVDNKDVHKLTNADIIYYYDNGILYDKNHVKVMDYDLYIKHEEERKKFTDINAASEAELSKEYDDRLINKDEPKLEAFGLSFDAINAFGENLTEGKHTETCCICGEEIDGYGNNPAPVKDEGRCCNACNIKFVIPARLELLKADNQELAGNSEEE